MCSASLKHDLMTGVGIDWTFASHDDEGGAALSSVATRAVALVVSVGGMLVTALMLGIVSETIGDKIESLKKGTSDVLEDNHRCGSRQCDPAVA